MARGWGGGGGEAIILNNISIEGGDYSREVINRGMALTGGNTGCHYFVGPSALLDMNLWI